MISYHIPHPVGRSASDVAKVADETHGNCADIRDSDEPPPGPTRPNLLTVGSVLRGHSILLIGAITVAEDRMPPSTSRARPRGRTDPSPQIEASR